MAPTAAAAPERRPPSPSRSHTRAVERPPTPPTRTGAEWALTFFLADLLTEARTHGGAS